MTSVVNENVDCPSLDWLKYGETVPLCNGVNSKEVKALINLANLDTVKSELDELSANNFVTKDTIKLTTNLNIYNFQLDFYGALELQTSSNQMGVIMSNMTAIIGFYDNPIFPPSVYIEIKIVLVHIILGSFLHLRSIPERKDYL